MTTTPTPTTPAKAATPAQDHLPHVLHDAVCTHCGCTCDDIDLLVADNQIIEARRACLAGKSWFLAPRPKAAADEHACSVDGRAATFEAAVDRAAEILTQARWPLVYGLSETTCEAQRVATSIADWIGGTIDTLTSVCHGPTGMAFAGVGEVTCTLGEIRNRADVVVFWGADPIEHQPRHLTKYSLTPPGLFVPRGRLDRKCIVVDVERTKTADVADTFVQIKPGSDFEALWTLRALARGLMLDAAHVRQSTGIELAVWQELMQSMKQATFGAILFGMGLTMSRGRHLNSEAVLALVRDMNLHTRFVCKAMRGRGNVAGADQVLTWRTGYPFGVNLSRGFPRFNPGEYTAQEMLARGEPDAALVVGSDPVASFPEPARQHLQSIPLVVLDPRRTATADAAAVAFRTATYGIHTPGTVYRVDDVPLPLRPALGSDLPSDRDVLVAIEQRVREIGASARECGAP